jgi:hypothetical protein
MDPVPLFDALWSHSPCCQAGAEFSFDFLLLLLLASAIAFMGLLESSSVVLGTAAFFSIFVQYQ